MSNVKKENKFLLSITVFARNHFRLKIEHSGQNFNSTFFISVLLLHWHKVRHVVMVTSREKNKSWFKEHLGLVEFLVFTLYISLPRPESYPVHTDWILITIFELIEVTFSYNYKYSGKTKSLNWKLPNLFENLYPIYCKVYLYSFIKYVLYTYLLFYII